MTDPRIGTVLDERYQILDELGSGGMGVVYRGERLRLGRSVAIKFLHAWMAADASFLKRFEIEARAMAKLQHPHCASVIDFGVEGKAPYVVMDLIAGTSLRALLDRESLPVARAIDITRQVLSGLAHAHEQGITHRDIKPDNIMVDASGAFGDQVRILDFGLAKLREGATGLTTGFVVGTPDYMAPEQTMAESVDERTDVYAVGVLLFVMLTGRPPFRAETMGEVMRMHREAVPPRLATAAPDAAFSPALEDVVARALAKEPAQRFPSAAAFATALDAVPEAVRGPIGDRASTGEGARPATGGDAHRATSSGAPPEGGSRDETEHDRLGSAATAFLSESMPAVADATAPSRPEIDPGATASLQPSTDPGQTYPGQASSPTAPSIDPGATAALRPQSSAEQASPAPAQGSTIDAGTPMTAASMPGAPANMAPALSPTLPQAPGRARRPRWLGPAIAVAVLGILLAIGLSGSGDPTPAAVATQPPDTAGAEAVGEVGDGETAPGPDRAEPTATSGPPDTGSADDEAAQGAAEPGHGAPDSAEPPGLAKARALIEAGRTTQARKLLEKLRPRHQGNAEIHYLLGRLYFGELWCRDGIDAYQAAIARRPAYRSDPMLIESAVVGLANDKYYRRVSRFIEQTIGAPAIPYLEDMAADPAKRDDVRKRAARTLARLR